MLAAGDIYAGPILRRASPKSVAIWIATTKQVELDGLIRKAGGAQRIGETTTVDRLKVFESLFVHLIQVTAKEGTFPAGALLEYSLGAVVSDGNTDHSGFPPLVAAEGLAYTPYTLPTFYLQASGAKLNVLYGSCRKAHDIAGGDKDALSYGDTVTANNVNTVASRPTLLCLGGDQIYADDVHGATFDALTTIANRLEGSSKETMPKGVVVPGKGQRQKWTEQQARFTSGEAKNHLVTFAEYVAMYGLAYNQQNWPSSALPKELLGYRDGLKAVRRLLANTPTYMIFDDHDVTDDWNLSLNWIEAVNQSAVGSRIVANALAAYWLFQAWGNDPAADAAVVPQVRDALKRRLSHPDELASVVEKKSKLNAWEFQTPTLPTIFFLDTRTNRGHLRGFEKVDQRAPAFLKSTDAWLSTLKRLQAIVKVQGRRAPLIIVATGPVFGYTTIDKMQQAVSGAIGPTTFDLEGWSANEAHFFLFLVLCGDLDVVAMSGDVHYAFTSTASFSVFDGDFLRAGQAKLGSAPWPKKGSGPSATYDFLYASRFLQLNSSATRNSTGGGLKQGFMQRMAMPQGETGFLITGMKMDKSVGHFRNGELYKRVANPGVAPTFHWAKVSAVDAKPNFVLQQRINDALNSPYLDKHNLGYASFLGRRVENGFLVDGKLTSRRSWDFATDAAWAPSAP